MFFTIGPSVAPLSRAPGGVQWPAFALAIGGLAIVASHVSALPGVADSAPCSCSSRPRRAAVQPDRRAAGRVDALGFMAWPSPFAALPLWIITLLQNGPRQVVASPAMPPSGPVARGRWQSIGNMLFGDGVWNGLLARDSPSPSCRPRSSCPSSA